MVQEYLSDEPAKWGKLASTIQWRRLQLLLLREILVELRKLSAGLAEMRRQSEPAGAGAASQGPE